MNNHTDLTDVEWDAIKDIVPAVIPGGRPAKYTRREIVDGIMYVLSNNCSWRQLPTRYPPWNTVFVYYNRWRKEGVFLKFSDAMLGHLKGR